MKDRHRLALTLIAAAAVAPLSPMGAAAQTEDPVSASIRFQYAPVKRNIVAAAEQMPESLYAYRPTEEVRSFGQLIGHLAFAQFTICAGLRGEDSPRPGNLEEQLSTKAELVAAITEAFAYCDGVYERATDASMGEEVQFFGSTAVRHYPLMFALLHANEHYGNIVTYMRLNGMVPPSSQGG